MLGHALYASSSIHLKAFEGIFLHETDGGTDYLEIVDPSVQDVFSCVDCDTSIVLDKKNVLE